MTDIFLSYSSTDRGEKDKDGNVQPDRAGPILKLLEDQGFNVFWDRHIPHGANWDKTIKQKLKEAKCALVLWSKHSIDSDNVAHEATIARDEGKLIAVLIDPLKADQLPMGMYTQQGLQLIGWSPEDTDDARWQNVLREIEAKLAPHAPLWFQAALHAHEAELAAEKEKVKSAQSETKEIKKSITKSAQSVFAAERDRDAAIDEAATLKEQLKEVSEAHAALERRLKQAQDDLRTAKTAQEELSAKLEAVEVSKDSASELESLKQKLAGTERELEDAKRDLKQRKPWPTTRGGTGYTILAGATAFVSFFSLSEVAGGAASLEALKPLLRLGLPVEAGLTGAGIAFVLSAIMLVVRRRQLGALELAFYWFALMAPPAILLAAVVASWVSSSYTSDTAYPYFVGFFVGWLLLVASAFFFSARRGPGLTSPAIAVYWLGICLPWFWLPVANYAYYGLFGFAPFYIRPLSGEDYSGYVIALVLIAASGFYVWRRWPRRSPGAVSAGANIGSWGAGAIWLVAMTLLTLLLVVTFNINDVDWVGAVYDPTAGRIATGALVALVIAVASVLVLRNMRSPLGDGEARIYWLGCTASAILFITFWFTAKEINLLGLTNSTTGALWTGFLFGLAAAAAVFGIRRYRNR